MSTIWTLTFSVFKMFVRNRHALFFTLFMPAVIMLIFGLVAFDRPPKVTIGIVSVSPTPSTQGFLNRLNTITVFNVHTGSQYAEIAALERGDRTVVLLVPDNLIPDATGGTVPTPQSLTMLTNVGQPQMVQMAMSVIQQILDNMTFTLQKVRPLFQLKTQPVNSRNLKYIDFLLPGIIAMAVMQMTVFSVAFVFVSYRERGILKRLMATPMKPSQFVSAFVITRLIVAIVQTAIFILIGVYVFHAHVYGSYWLVFLLAILGSVMFLGLGFSISGLAKTVEAVPAIANLIVIPMLFLGGVFFPTSAMPEWLQGVIKYLPLTFFSHSLREVTMNGAGLNIVTSDVVWMISWSVALIMLANITFGFAEKEG